MLAAFLGSGMLLSLFAAGLHHHFADHGPPPLGTRLLGVAGLGLALLACKTDPTYLPTPRTLAGALHDAAYVLLGLTLLPGMLLLASTMRRRSAWRALAAPTVVTVLLAAPAFVFKGVAFYGFLILILAWFIVCAGWLWHHAQRARA
ncbi:DUF998 domain-containing protein [Candidatus Gracilibacteria bacterium]|nr:DUF998 domain-containing protein [Candidatus Gracilibacteria bacterium]